MSCKNELGLFHERKIRSFKKSIDFKAMVEKMRVSFEDFEDRWKRRVSKEFEEYYKNFGIRRRLTIRKTAHQNGLHEKKNRSLEEAARSLMHDKKQLIFKTSILQQL